MTRHAPLSLAHPARLAMVHDLGRGLYLLDDPRLPGDPEMDVVEAAHEVFAAELRRLKPQASPKTIERHFDRLLADALIMRRELRRRLGRSAVGTA
jgi:hypothetical protein